MDYNGNPGLPSGQLYVMQLPGREARRRIKETYEQAEQRKEERRRRIIQRMLVDARKLDLVVDECEVTADPDLRQDLLGQGLSASIHGLDVVAGEHFVEDPEGYLVDVKRPPGWDIEAGLEALRGDAASLKTFLSAESRMLADLGLPPNAVARTRSAIAYVIVEAHTRIPDELSGQLSELRSELLQDRGRLQDPMAQHRIWRRLTRVLEAFGGILVIVGAQFTGGIAVPVTAGLSVYGSVLSQAVGIEVLKVGMKRARREGARRVGP